jgi:quercetin dioxygenase-like cupin family protein
LILIERTKADVDQLAKCNRTTSFDAQDWTGIVVKKPWGYEQEIHKGGVVSLWKLNLSPGAETSMHCHPNKRTALIVQSGTCVLETLNAVYPLIPGDMAHIEMGAFHRTRTGDGCVLLEIETPINKSDLVRLDDRYGRAGMAYECA